ncbi:MAG: hypothetical protein ABW206_00280 [Agrobacterium vaccinii]
MKPKTRQAWALYCRSYLLTLGVILFAGSAFTLHLASEGQLLFEWWAWLLTAFISLTGFTLIALGIFGSNSLVDKWGDAASTHEASIFLMILAFPIYWLLKQTQFFRR